MNKRRREMSGSAKLPSEEKPVIYRLGRTKFSQPASDFPESPAVHPMQRMTRGELGFLQHVVPPKVDLTLDYAKLEPLTAETPADTGNGRARYASDTPKSRRREISGSAKLPSEGRVRDAPDTPKNRHKKRYRHASAQTKTGHGIIADKDDTTTQTGQTSCEMQRCCTLDESIIESVIHPKVVIQVASRTESVSAKHTIEAAVAESYRKARTNMRNFRLFKRCFKSTTRFVRSIAKEWRTFIYMFCEAFCVCMIAYVFIEAGLLVTFILCFMMVGSFRVLESGLACFSTIPMELHRRILARRQRAIVHRTLDYMATHEFSVKVEDVENIDLERDTKTNETFDNKELESCNGHELIDKCSECCRFLK